MTMTDKPKTPTLADLRRLAKARGMWIVKVHVEPTYFLGPDPEVPMTLSRLTTVLNSPTKGKS